MIIILNGHTFCHTFPISLKIVILGNGCLEIVILGKSAVKSMTINLEVLPKNKSMTKKKLIFKFFMCKINIMFGVKIV